LKGLSETELPSLAYEGAIVVFNLSDIRSEVFVITLEAICSIHLPLLTSNVITRLAKLFQEAINEDILIQYRYSTHKMNTVLQDLWDFGIKTILEELGFAKSPVNGRWPRV